MNKPLIVTLDIETAPYEAYVWGLWDQNVGLNQIKTEWSLLSFAAKRLDQKKVLYRDNRGQKNTRDDRALMIALWTVLNDSDIIVAQNGKRFDVKRINARFALLGFSPPSPYRVVDTMVEAKKYFGFTSNKLEWLSKHLTPAKKSSHKKFPGFELWLECLADNKAAWDEMRRYNVLDVVACEQLYLKLRPWINNHPNVAAYEEGERETCPKCGSADVQRRGFVHTQSGKYARLRCNGCYGWTRSKTNLLVTSKRKKLLA